MWADLTICVDLAGAYFQDTYCVIRSLSTLCLKKSSPFLFFCDYSVKCWPILIIFGSILQLRKYANKCLISFLYTVISSLCMNITE